MKGDLGNVFGKRYDEREIPCVERRMRLAAHIHHLAHKGVFDVLGVQRFDLGMLSLGEIVDVIPLNRLVEKRESQSEYEQRDD